MSCAMRTAMTRPYTAMIPDITTGTNDYFSQQDKPIVSRDSFGWKYHSCLHDKIRPKRSHTRDTNAGLSGSICCTHCLRCVSIPIFRMAATSQYSSVDIHPKIIFREAVREQSDVEAHSRSTHSCSYPCLETRSQQIPKVSGMIAL